MDRYAVHDLTDRELNALWCAMYVFKDYLCKEPYREKLYIDMSELDVLMKKDSSR